MGRNATRQSGPTRLGSDPQIPVARLRDRLGSSAKEAILNPPGGVRILVMLRLGSRAKAKIEIKASEAHIHGAPQQ